MDDAKIRKKYCCYSLRCYGLLCLLLGFLIFTAQFLLRMRYEDTHFNTFGALTISFIPSILLFLIPVCLTIRFNRMIDQQEEMFGISFSDDDAVSVSRNGLVFLSKDWLIYAGSAAFHKDYILKITYGVRRSKSAAGYRLYIRTRDGRLWDILVGDRLHCVKVRRWWKDSKERHEAIYEL